MLYNYDFDIAALAINTLLLVIILTRKNFKNINNIILKGIIAVNEVAIIFDIWSVFTISYPEKYSMFVNYFVSIGYYLAHNFSAIIFAMYGLHTTKMDETKKKRAKGVLIGVAIFELLFITTTSITKFAFYYDSDMVYKHGSIMWLLYLIAILIIIYVLHLKIKNMENQAAFQFVSIAFYIGIIVFSYLFNIAISGVLIELCAASIGLVFLYIAQDGPEAYEYKKLPVFNRYAFEERTNYLMERNRRFKVLIFMPRDAKIFISNYGHNQIFTIEKYIINRCISSRKMKNRLFAMSEICMALVIKDDEDEKKYIDEINKKFASTAHLDGRNYNFEMTYGLIKCPDSIGTYSELIDVISPLIYRVSLNAGDDIIEVDSSWISRETEKEIVNALKKGIKNKEIYIEYLPIFDCERLYSHIAETNIKFKVKEGEFIYLNDVVHIAEKYGLMSKIDELMLEKVGSFIKRKKMLELGVQCLVINLSVTRLYEKDFGDLIANIMKQYKIPKKKICFEIKELKSSEAQPVVRSNIQKLHDAGLMFMLGNFGRSRLDFDFLISAPISVVAISQNVLENVANDSRRKAVLIDLIEMLKDINIISGCEGVSSKKEENIIRATSCKYVCGPKYSLPLSEDDYIEFLKVQFSNIMNDLGER